jgi:hypothetical protein
VHVALRHAQFPMAGEIPGGPKSGVRRL